MKTQSTFIKLALLGLIVSVVSWTAPSARAANASVTTVGTASASANTAQDGSSPNFTSVSQIVVTEGANGNYANNTAYTFTLAAPSGWAFDTGGAAPLVAKNGGGSDIVGSPVITVVDSTTITVTFTTDAAGGAIDILTITGIRVQPTTGVGTGSSTVTLSSSPTVTGLTGATAATLTKTAGAANKLAFGVQPSNTGAGNTISPAVTVQLQDQFGNLTTSSASVTVAIGNNPNSGTLSGTKTATASSGTATFSTLSINNVGIGYTLTASSGVLAGATSSSFNVTPAIAQRGSATEANANATTLTIIKPSGVVAGDVMIANIDLKGGSKSLANFSGLLGWTSISSVDYEGSGADHRCALLYKVAGSSEPSSYTFTVDSLAANCAGAIVGFSGVDTTGGYLVGGGRGGPFDVAPSSYTTGSGTSISGVTAITTASANAAVLMFVGGFENNTITSFSTTSPGSLTALYGGTANANASVGAGWGTKATAGSTGAGSATESVNHVWGAILLALKPSLATTATSVSSSANPALPGANVTFTATVSGSGGTPSGTVTFKDGGTTLGTGTLDGSGVATYSTSSLSHGTHSITAVYGGDSFFGSSTSSTLTQTINTPPVTATHAFGTITNVALSILETSLVALDYDPDHDAMSITSVSSISTNNLARSLGNNVTVSGSGAAATITYTPATDFVGQDTFTYVVTDALGGATTITVKVTARTTALVSSGISSANTVYQAGVGMKVVAFGLPGRTYWIQVSRNSVSGPWSSISTNTAPTSGVIYETDADATNYTSSFYRLALPQ